MLEMKQLLAAIQQQRQTLPPGAIQRWAFLVTFEEIAALVEECQNDAQLGLAMDSQYAQHIKDGRAMWNINGTPILPELMEESSIKPLDG